MLVASSNDDRIFHKILTSLRIFHKNTVGYLRKKILFITMIEPDNDANNIVEN